MAKIYTKTGDKGQTGLVGGKRISKGASRIEAYGNVDELNAILGVASSLLRPEEDADIPKILAVIQEKLFVAGADLATPPDHHGARLVPRIQRSDVEEIEKWIDDYDARLPALAHFILPSGTTAGSFLHLARTVCRRTEREVVRLSKAESMGEEVMKFLNRLSDFLFVLARTINKRQSVAEIPWMPAKSPDSANS